MFTAHAHPEKRLKKKVHNGSSQLSKMKEGKSMEKKTAIPESVNGKTEGKMLPTANNVRHEQKGNLIILRNFATMKTFLGYPTTGRERHRAITSIDEKRAED